MDEFQQIMHKCIAAQLEKRNERGMDTVYRVRVEFSAKSQLSDESRREVAALLLRVFDTLIDPLPIEPDVQVLLRAAFRDGLRISVEG